MINELQPIVQTKVNAFVELCKSNGINLLITCAYRSIADQDALYAQGRTKPGNIVTNAKGGQSFHQYRVAIDVCPLVGGKLDWNFDFNVLGTFGKLCGLEWGGDWTTFIDKTHFQYTDNHPLSDFQENKIDWNAFNQVEPLQTNQNKTMSTEHSTGGGYKFTNKETGEVIYGRLEEAGQGYDKFILLNGEEVTVKNTDMKGDMLENDKYTVVDDQTYTGPLP